MEEESTPCIITREDLRKARTEMETYLDVTEEDLLKLYILALGYARQRHSQEVPVSDVMAKNVVAVQEDADIHEAVRLISEKGVGGLPVVDGSGRVTGVITDSDVLFMLGVERRHGFKSLLRYVRGERSSEPKEGKVREFMTSPPVVITADRDIREAAGLLEAKRIKRLPVVDARGMLVGVVTRADLLREVVRP